MKEPQKHFDLSKHLYLTSLLFFEIARTLPHAILMIFLFETFNAQPPSILALQLILYLAIFLFEIPSGILSDVLFSKKTVYVFATFSMIVSVGIMVLSSNIFTFGIGQFFYGIANALSTGTMEVFILEQLKDKQKKINFLNQSRVVSFLGAILGGGIGPFIYAVLKQNLYFVSFALLLLSLAISIWIKNTRTEKVTFPQFRSEFCGSLKTNIGYFKNKHYLLLILPLFLVSFLYAPFFNYWQVFYVDNNIPTTYFGVVYVALQIIGVATAIINSKIKNKKSVYFLSLLLAPLLFCAALLLLKGITFAFLFPSFLFFLNYYQFSSQNSFMLKLKRTTGGGQVSVVSTIKTLLSLFMYLIIYLLSILLNVWTASIISALVFLVSAFITFVIQQRIT